MSFPWTVSPAGIRLLHTAAQVFIRYYYASFPIEVIHHGSCIVCPPRLLRPAWLLTPASPWPRARSSEQHHTRYQRALQPPLAPAQRADPAAARMLLVRHGQVRPQQRGGQSAGQPHFRPFVARLPSPQQRHKSGAPDQVVCGGGGAPSIFHAYTCHTWLQAGQNN